MFLYPVLALCAVLTAALVYRYDLYEREPWFMLAIAVGLGIPAMELAGVAETATLDRLPGPGLGTIALVAATHEEGIRLLLVGGLAWFVPRHFNDPMDGLIYGSMVGLGMAIDESVSHIEYLPEKPSILPPTEVVRLLGHLVLGGITCFGWGLARTAVRGWAAVLAACVTGSVTWHFCWDWIAFTAWRTGDMTIFQTAAAIGLMVTGLLVYGALVVSGARHSRARFAPESRREVWGWPFTVWRRRPR